MSISFVSCKYHPRAKLEENFSVYCVACCECGLVVMDHLIEEDRPILYQNHMEDYSEKEKYFHNFLASCKIINSIPQKFMKKISLEVDKIISMLQLSKSIMKNTLSTIKQICMFDEIRHCNREAIIYSCIFIACKKENIAFSFKDMCETSTITKQLIGKTFKKIMKRLVDKSNNISVKKIIEVMCEKLDVSSDLVNISYIIVSKAIMLNIVTNHSPISIIAAAILLVVSSTGKEVDINDTGNRLSLSKCNLQEAFNSFSLHSNNLLPTNI